MKMVNELWPHLAPMGKLHERFELLLVKRFPFFPPLWGNDNLGLARFGGRVRLCYQFESGVHRPLSDASTDIRITVTASVLYSVWDRYLKAENAFNNYTKQMVMELETAVKTLETHEK